MWLYNKEVSNHSKCKAFELKKKMICQYSNFRLFFHFDHEMTLTLTFRDLGDLFGRSPISMDYFYQILKSVHIGVQ